MGEGGEIETQNAARCQHLGAGLTFALLLGALLLGLGACETYRDVVRVLLPDLAALPLGAFEQPARPLTGPDRARFLAGHEAFQAACGACHLGDVRAAPPLVAGKFAETAILRLVPPDPNHGARLDPRTATGVSRVAVTYKALAGRLPDGEAYELRLSRIELSDPAAAPLAEGTAISLRAAPPVIGYGLIAAIEDSVLLAAADPEDRDGDGISGRNPSDSGRFGWKADAAGFAHDGMATADPDGALAFYLDQLGPPRRPAPDDPRVARGEAIFEAVGCAACHPRLAVAAPEPGAVPNAPPRSFYPYSDFLLHDMGRGLAEEGAGPAAREWRSAPLWGLGLVQSKGAAYLHDGRARNLMEAILWHGGEARTARKKVRALAKDDRAALIAFLESL